MDFKKALQDGSFNRWKRIPLLTKRVVRNMRGEIHQKRRSAVKLREQSAMLKGCVRKQCAIKHGGRGSSRTSTKEKRDGVTPSDKTQLKLEYSD